MKTVTILYALFLVACAKSTVSSDKHNIERSLAEVKGGKEPIAILGDSLAYGYGASTATYKPQGCLSNLQNDSVINYSYPGLTSEQIASRADAILSQKPKLVFVSAGGNDTLLNMKMPGTYSTEKSLKAMAGLFDRLVSSGAVVVYLGLNPPIPGTERLSMISKMAQEKRILVVDGMQGFWGNPIYMRDKIHPNEQGYKIMCDRLLAAIRSKYP